MAHGVGADSRCLTALPLFHVIGLNLLANPALYTGGTDYVAKTFGPVEALPFGTFGTAVEHSLYVVRQA